MIWNYNSFPSQRTADEKIANKGDAIICYSDGTYDVEVKLR